MALLAHVGVSWYTALEQGRDTQPSEAVLEGIAAALQLPPEDQWHLFVLADRIPPSCITPPSEAVTPALKRFLDDLRTSPAYAMSATADLAYWNTAAEAAFGLSTSVPPHEHNLVWRLFADPASRERYAGWVATARSHLARFRAGMAGRHSDPRLAMLLDDLQHVSVEFSTWWSRYEVAGDSDRREVVIHPGVGPSHWSTPR